LLNDTIEEKKKSTKTTLKTETYCIMTLFKFIGRKVSKV